MKCLSSLSGHPQTVMTSQQANTIRRARFIKSMNNNLKLPIYLSSTNESASKTTEKNNSLVNIIS